MFTCTSANSITINKFVRFCFDTGFVWDRHWVVINSKGRACTQRVEPKLALVQVEMPMEAFSLGWEPKKTSYLGISFFLNTTKTCHKKDTKFHKRCPRRNCLCNMNWFDLVRAVVRGPGMTTELKISLTKPSLRSDGISVWEWCGSALDEGDEAAKWFTEYLGKPSRLVRFNEGKILSRFCKFILYNTREI